VVPVSGASGRQLHVALDEQDAGVADLAAALLVEAEALLEERLVPLAVGEAGTGTTEVSFLTTFRDFGKSV
jgi:hypothetical protein